MTKRNFFWSDEDVEAADRAWDRIAKEDAEAKDKTTHFVPGARAGEVNAKEQPTPKPKS